MSLLGLLLCIGLISGFVNEPILVAGENYELVVGKTESFTHSIPSPLSISYEGVAAQIKDCNNDAPGAQYAPFQYNPFAFYFNETKYNYWSCYPPSGGSVDPRDNTYGRFVVAAGTNLFVAADDYYNTGLLYFFYQSYSTGWTARVVASEFGSPLTGVAVSRGFKVIATAQRSINGYYFSYNVDNDNVLSTDIAGTFSGILTIGAREETVAAIYTPDGETHPRILAYTCPGTTLSGCINSSISQSDIPNHSPSTTFGTQIAAGGPSDNYIVVTDSTKGELYLFKRISNSAWSYVNTLNIGVGSGKKLTLTTVQDITLVALTSTNCSEQVSSCVVFYALSPSGTWNKAYEVSDNSTNITEFAESIAFTVSDDNRYALENPIAPTFAPRLTVASDFFLLTSINVNWTSENAISVDGIELQYRKAGDSEWITADGDVLSCLSPGQQYIVRGAVVNQYGKGPYAEVTVNVSPSTLFTAVQYDICKEFRSCYGVSCYPFTTSCTGVSDPVFVIDNIYLDIGATHESIDTPFTCAIDNYQICCKYVYKYYQSTYLKYNTSSCAALNEPMTMRYYEYSEFSFGGGSSYNYDENYDMKLFPVQINKKELVIGLCGQQFVDENPETVIEDPSPSTGSSVSPLAFVGFVLVCILCLLL